MSYPALVLKAGKERAVRNRHPWVFSGAVATEAQAEAGAVVQVVSAGGEVLAYGHYAPESPIRVRLFAFAGGPEPVFDEGFWRARWAAALALRARHLDLTRTDGYRLLSAEGDGCPGLVVDRYADLAVAQLRGPGALALATWLVAWLAEQGVRHVLAKAETEAETRWLLGGVDRVVFRENDLRFEVNPVQGQKTGFFLDQRDARSLVGRLARGAEVHNVFAYSGGFGVYALAGGAERVVSVDSSAEACRLADTNAALNGFGPEQHTSLAADAFEYLRTLPAQGTDLIVLDPPAFTKHVGTVERASRGYKDLNLKAFAALKPGGILATFSCSQPISRDLLRKIVFGAAADARRPVRLLYQTGHPPDHPIDLYHPEGEYLKGLVLQVG